MTVFSFVACCKTKGIHAQPAASLYTSPLFRKSLIAALDKSDRVYILSGKHGALSLETLVEPYDLPLSRLNKDKLVEWSRDVGAQIADLIEPRDEVYMYCGHDYIAPISATLKDIGCKTFLPLGTLSMGSRLAALRRLNEEEALESAGARFDKLIRRLEKGLGSSNTLASIRPKSVPSRGLYLIGSADAATHVVRVGTHAVSKGSKTTLWNRLSTHRGTRDGRGSHRSSIFRSHVGKAIMAGRPSLRWPSTWGVGQQAPADIREGEEALEQAVSEYLVQLKLLWLWVPDDAGPLSDRAYLERNCIGLLSRLGILHASSTSGWLGLYSHDWRISATGLWNLSHIFARPDKDFLDVLERYVDATLGFLPMPSGSIAPKGWHKGKIRRPKDQLDLFSSEGTLSNADD